ncbi:MAG: energy-coupling factor transporter transmembrane protein EcfT [Jiangellaceae bacterium]|nr:energy-coupling factor transporter transmembrane protein EcfT [Jiangellaceae bacterium]
MWRAGGRTCSDRRRGARGARACGATREGDRRARPGFRGGGRGRQRHPDQLDPRRRGSSRGGRCCSGPAPRLPNQVTMLCVPSWRAAWLPRQLHAGAWWLWALGVGAAASRTTNPVLLGLLLGVAAYVVSVRRSSAPWGGAFNAFLRLALVVITIRVVFQAIFGAHVGGSTVLFRLPAVQLPEWAASLKLGGPITLEAVLLAFYDGLRLAVILCCLGAANALADARRLLRSVPGALYEIGVALVVAMTFAPRLAEDGARIRRAHRLRGRGVRGIRGLGQVAMPVLEGSLERALELAAAMDSRGFARAATVPDPHRRAASVLVVGGLLGVCVGLYGLLDGGGLSAAGSALVGCGVGLAAGGFVLAGRSSTRTRYRPDPWGFPEWVVAGSGGVAATTFALAAGQQGMNLLVVPLVLPAVPLLPLAGALVALLPAWVAPQPAEAS